MGSEVTAMNTYVICKGDDGETGVTGPFEDQAWADAWLVQHNNDPYNDDPLLEHGNPTQESWEATLTVRLTDPDHWCEFGSGQHEVVTAHVPGFDPTTLPRRI